MSSSSSCCNLITTASAATNSSASFSWCSRLSASNRNLSLRRAPISSHPPPPLTTLTLQVQAKTRTRGEDRTARHARIRKKVEGTPERPRLCVFRSNKHLYVQVIDDSKMHTLASASTMQKPISELFDFSSSPTIDVAKKVGEVIAKSCLEKGITKVAFDRGGYPYHGRIEALADAAREHGLQF
ncbi:OLC1v1011946C1 [Oldenlandia corymbosa var. corymbosa]|uniref:Large ribosomal subunit protein uL18c n=1 Tax=Oldenlandia corymbosa var. corymbosa TaxID=529605 RepID=A0AAV1DY56_OLDCO|nr:OLC1v1011946C1 [Oldenlandia corymbosa var. corymbosa]